VSTKPGMRARIAIVLTVLCLVTTTGAQAQSAVGNSFRDAGETPAKRTPGSRDGALAVAWNQVAYDLAYAEDQFLTFKGVRAFSMMHIAIHDALNAVVPRYRRYAYHDRARRSADPIAAAARAAYDVLVSQYPSAQERLADELASWLEHVPEGPRKARGVALGVATGAAILALRDGDGFDLQGTYRFESGPGTYQTTPPWDGFVLQPGFRFATPFGLRSAEQFRPPPPPPLHSSAYAMAYNEVKNVGRIDSEVRTPEQTSYAVWWMEFTEGSMNRLARNLVTGHGTDLWKASRLFALLNMSMFDAYVATWDSKFAANHWRPYTAIRAAADDENQDTTADATWEPLRTTPPFPEYVSAHSTVCSSSFEILSRTFGRHVAFTMDTTTAPPGMPTRSFVSFRSAAEECADSRVRLGWHFRYATRGGLDLGRRVAGYVATHHLD
jgi:hypothetical protein